MEPWLAQDEKLPYSESLSEHGGSTTTGSPGKMMMEEEGKAAVVRRCPWPSGMVEWGRLGEPETTPPSALDAGSAAAWIRWLRESEEDTATGGFAGDNSLVRLSPGWP